MESNFIERLNRLSAQRFGIEYAARHYMQDTLPDIKKKEKFYNPGWQQFLDFAKGLGWTNSELTNPNDELDMYVYQAGCGGMGCTMDRMESWSAAKYIYNNYIIKSLSSA